MDIFFIEALKGQLVEEVYDLGRFFNLLLSPQTLTKRKLCLIFRL